jgi:hypothetical protein
VKCVVGDKISLALKLWDSNPSAKVRCDLYDFSGQLYKSVHLYSAGDGLYLNTDEEMPDKALIASYKIIDSDQYADTAEQIFPLPKVQPAEKYVTGMVKSVQTISEYIVGVVK